METSGAPEQKNFSILSDDERTRSRGFKFDEDRQRFIIGRASLRRVLSAYTGIIAPNIRFHYGEFGKPSLARVGGMANETGMNISFNCTHSGDLFLCAVSGCGSIGIDIERIRPIADPVGLAQAYFSPDEITALEGLGACPQQRAFYDGWTRKEAYIKAIGRGLSARLNRFSVSLSPGQEPRILSCADTPAHCAEFSIYAVTATPGYVGAIAANGAKHKLSFRWFPRSLI